MNQIPVKDVTDPKKPKDDSYDLYAKREHIYVKFYKGLFKNLRIISGAFMLVMFFGFSWIQWDGRQAVLFDLPNRQFHVFGLTFWPQDFMLLSWLLIILAFVLFFVTVFAGRLWCGYSCPQFVWTWLFIWAERITEGDRNHRMKLDKAPFSLSKAQKKTFKHVLWLIIARASAVAFVGYFSPIRELVPNLLSWNLGPWETWWIGFIAVATYANAGWLREQVCIYMCPYARFQSVMFDEDTLVISYDEKRGEPRGKRKKSADPSTLELGACIDCDNCVHVCPVGIDIRDGLQYECIACGACVDACNDIMDRMGYERGLVRYTTEHELEGKKTHIFRPRLIGYFAVLIVMCGAFAYTLGTRVPVELELIRDRGQLYLEAANNRIENIYTLKLANKEQAAHEYALSAVGPAGVDIELFAPKTIKVAPGELAEVLIRCSVDKDQLTNGSFDLKISAQAIDGSGIEITKENRFIGPLQSR
jgi:cytochrome c oxidase accessory protein FixG